MKRLIKYTALLIAALFTILMAALIVMTTVIKPNDHKEMLAQKISEALHAQVAIGKITWQFYPWIGLSLHDVSMKNKQNQPMIAVANSAIKVKLIPLFDKKVEVDKVFIDTPNISLISDKNGKLNWSDITEANATSSTEKQSHSKKQTVDPLPIKEKTEKESIVFTFSIKEILIEKGNLHYEDQSTQTDIYLSDIAIKSHNLALNKDFPIKTSFIYEKTQQALKETLRLKTEGDIQIKMAQQITVALNNWNIAINDQLMQLTGLLKTSDKLPLIDVKITATTLDLDKMLPQKAITEKTASISDEKNNAATTTPIPPTTLPLDLLKEMNLKLDFQAQNIQTLPFQITMPHMQLEAKNGLIQLKKMQAQIWEGMIDTQVKIQVRDNLAFVDLNLKSNNMQMSKILKDLAQKELIQGVFNTEGSFTSQGDTVESLIKNLKGSTVLASNKVLIESFNLTDQAYEYVGKSSPMLRALLEGSEKIPTIGRTKNTEISDFSTKINVENETIIAPDIQANTKEGDINGIAQYHWNNNILNLEAILPIRNKTLSTIRWYFDCHFSELKKCGLNEKAIGKQLEDLAKEKAKEKLTGYAEQLNQKLTDEKIEQAKEKIDEKKEVLKEKLNEKLNRFLMKQNQP